MVLQHFCWFQMGQESVCCCRLWIWSCVQTSFEEESTPTRPSQYLVDEISHNTMIARIDMTDRSTLYIWPVSIQSDLQQRGPVLQKLYDTRTRCLQLHGLREVSNLIGMAPVGSCAAFPCFLPPLTSRHLLFSALLLLICCNWENKMCWTCTKGRERFMNWENIRNLLLRTGFSVCLVGLHSPLSIVTCSCMPG